MTTKHVWAWILLAGLLGHALLAVPTGPPSAGASPLVIFLTDESLYLCPLCGDRFLAVFKQIASRVGPGRVWVAVAGEKFETKAGATEFRAAVKKRIEAFLRSNGIICPVMDDSSGALRGPGGALPACITFDTASGSVRSFALSQMEIKKTP
jgi:hypothetical protein